MTKRLVAYFSASGNTAKAAQGIAHAIHADSLEIQPVLPYTKEDLNWMESSSRSSLEMKDSTSRPEIVRTSMSLEEYEEILLGFPIWWYVAPRIVRTFLESHDLRGKKIILFATSGGSAFGNTVKELQESAPEAHFIEGKIFHNTCKKEIQEWVRTL